MARRAAREASPFLSVVVPARNEAEGLPQLVAEIAAALRPLRDGGARPGRSRERQRAVGAAAGAPPLPDGRGSVRRLAGFEVIIVDDGSTDRTPEVLRGLAADYPELRGVVLAGGVGQSSATVAGIRAARGDWIATLDADLQNDPADLVRLWEALPGHDVALGWRGDRCDVWSRRVVSRWANRVRNAVLGQSIRDTGCSVRIFPREAALRLPAFRGVHRFLGPLLLREGCRLVQVPVGHRPRPHGRSHYNLWNRSLQVIIDLLGVAWLLRRPLAYRVLRAWDAAEMVGTARAGEAGGTDRPGAEE
jgi:glycosyltransferase involved in cell wall biosynthesis